MAEFLMVARARSLEPVFVNLDQVAKVEPLKGGGCRFVFPGADTSSVESDMSFEEATEKVRRVNVKGT